MKLTEITPKIGLGEMHFGIYPEDVKEFLGEPSEIDAADDDLDDGLEFWHFDEKDISVAFDGEHDMQMISIAVSSNDYTFHDQHFYQKTKDEIIDFLNDLNLDLQIEDEVISAVDLNLNFWLDDDKCSEIQWSAEIITEII